MRERTQFNHTITQQFYPSNQPGRSWIQRKRQRDHGGDMLGTAGQQCAKGVDELEEVLRLTTVWRVDGGVEERRNEDTMDGVWRACRNGRYELLEDGNEDRFSRRCERDIVHSRQGWMCQSLRQIKCVAEGLLFGSNIGLTCWTLRCRDGGYSATDCHWTAQRCSPLAGAIPVPNSPRRS